MRARARAAYWNSVLESSCGAGYYELLALVEIALQSFEIHKLIRLIASSWINRLCVAVIAANYCSISLVSTAFQRNDVRHDRASDA